VNKLVQELKKIVTFKDTTAAGDHVLIVSKTRQAMLYALVTSIDKDPERKDEWWQVRMHLFSVPPQKVVWTLREPQFTGREIFTMQGVEHFMQAVLLNDEGSMQSAGKQTPADPKSSGSRKNPFRIVK